MRELKPPVGLAGEVMSERVGQVAVFRANQFLTFKTQAQECQNPCFSGETLGIQLLLAIPQILGVGK